MRYRIAGEDEEGYWHGAEYDDLDEALKGAALVRSWGFRDVWVEQAPDPEWSRLPA